MRTLDPGHAYFLNDYSGDKDETIDSEQPLIFMHRIGPRYPGNDGSPYDGTNCQEVLRALISRSIYLNTQIPCKETTRIIEHLRSALWLFEKRAAREHRRELEFMELSEIELENHSTCRKCGHIVCEHRK